MAFCVHTMPSQSRSQVARFPPRITSPPPQTLTLRLKRYTRLLSRPLPRASGSQYEYSCIHSRQPTQSSHSPQVAQVSRTRVTRLFEPSLSQL
jgi:hypothetical protein